MLPLNILGPLIGALLLAGTSFGGGFYLEYRLDQASLIQARADLATARANTITLGNAVKACNASVDGIKIASDKLTASTQAAIDELESSRTKSQATWTAALNAIKSTDEKCPTADAIIQAGVQ